VYVFKPLTTILIVAAALLPGTFLADSYARAIGLGLLFSLLGDIWLMLPADRFMHGLSSFLLAHLCYIVAFLGGASAQGFAWVLLLLATIGAIILQILWQALSGPLKGAVGMYVAVIVTMAALAVGHAMAHFSIGTLFAAVGALLFLTSDAVLAINRFRRPFRLAQAAVLSTYFAGQLLIALSTGF
jgi:uncharacterized membrane protein YhhN